MLAQTHREVFIVSCHSAQSEQECLFGEGSDKKHRLEVVTHRPGEWAVVAHWATADNARFEKHRCAWPADPLILG